MLAARSYALESFSMRLDSKARLLNILLYHLMSLEQQGIASQVGV